MIQKEKIQVRVSKERIDAGEGDDGSRGAAIYTFAVRRFEKAQKKRGALTLDTTVELDPLPLPYIIWRVFDGNQLRFRWARRHRGKPEMRIGILTHGAEPSLSKAITACLGNNAARIRIQEDQP